MKKGILDDLEECLEQYFKIFLEYYPKSWSHNDADAFAPDELYQLSIRAHCLRAMLGSYCVDRLTYIGFDELIPFDNPIDWYNWAAFIRDNRVPREKYLSIGIRIDSELKRIRFLIEREGCDDYKNLSFGQYMVPTSVSDQKDTKDVVERALIVEECDEEKDKVLDFGQFQLNQQSLYEQEAISNLDKLHKKSSIISSWLTMIAKPFGL
ncbi:hypothetical protein [Vibrio sp. WXL103]|uniref:hypothetical protein n=1 Tax=Vibrio sp. WXL103 TaxID=3450710 RepID=UPI003EC5671D